MKKSSFLFVSIMALSISLFAYSIWTAYPVFQGTRLIDSLALIHSLPIAFYFSVALVFALCVGSLYYSINNKYLHIFLLLIFASMLWMAPYYLTSFVRLPLGLWKIAQSTHIEEILQGVTIPLSWYGKNYPASFVFNNVFLTVSGIDSLVFIRLAFPLFQLAVMILSMYVFLMKLFDQRIAFLAVLLTIPGLHYVVLQPAASSFGLLLFLPSLLLLTGEQLKRQILFALVFFVLVMSHSVYSALLLVLMVAAFVVQRIFGKFKVHVSPRLLLASSIWFLTWETAYVAPDRSIVFRLSFLFSADFWQRIFGGSKMSRVGTTVFSNINLIGSSTYLSYFIATLFILGMTYVGRRSLQYHRVSSKKERTFLRLNSLELWLFAGVVISGVVGVLMLFRTPDEAERALLVFILCSSCIAAYGFLGLGTDDKTGLRFRGRYFRKFVLGTLIGGVLVLVLVYPFVAYSIDSYSNHPFSENVGLEFSSKTTDSNVMIFIVSSESQYLFYKTDFKVISSDSFSAATGSDALNTIMTRDLASADVVVLRSTAYFLFSIKVDHSFENNRYLQLEQRLELSGFNLVYSNPSYEMWVKVRR